MDLPAVSKVMVAAIGNPVFLAASRAAKTSSNAEMVSIQSISTPPLANASACSVNAATAASWVSMPRGVNNSPVGPIDPATAISLPLAA